MDGPKVVDVDAAPEGRHDRRDVSKFERIAQVRRKHPIRLRGWFPRSLTTRQHAEPTPPAPSARRLSWSAGRTVMHSPRKRAPERAWGFESLALRSAPRLIRLGAFSCPPARRRPTIRRFVDH